MKTPPTGFLAGLLAGIVLTAAFFSGRPLVAGEAPPVQGAAKPASASKIVLENARVRVRDVTFPPGSAGMHTHELAHVGVVISGGTLEFKYPDGKSETAKLVAGGVGYRDANVTHEPVNPGTTPVRVIEVELK
ncbi:MAG TPA: cupin domain-containing protein [Vicinamibacterales bacterium]|nr:cupin domain-containing protein [Vicinamibacterales bacterium]